MHRRGALDLACVRRRGRSGTLSCNAHPLESTDAEMSTDGKAYVVKQGDCISSIALRFGLFWETIWFDAANASLRAKRDDPHILAPGDELTIPRKRARQQDCATDARHRFRRRGVPSVLRMVVLDCDEPCANQPYVLIVEGRNLQGVTDDDGRLEQPIPCDAKSATLIVTPGPDQIEYEIDLGTIDPIDTTRGVQARLTNLGYEVGAIDGDIGSQTWRAISMFCHEHTIAEPPEGTINQAFRNKLREIHGF